LFAEEVVFRLQRVEERFVVGVVGIFFRQSGIDGGFRGEGGGEEEDNDDEGGVEFVGFSDALFEDELFCVADGA